MGSLFILLITFIITPTFASCVLAQEKIIIGMPEGNFSLLPFQVAQKHGFYRKQGLDVQHVLMRPSSSVPALVNGNVDFITNFNILIHGAVKDLGVRIVFISAARQMYQLVVQPNIRSVGDLRKKVIGTSTAGTAPHIATTEVLKALGINPDRDVKLILGASAGVSAEHLRRKMIDAAMIQPPLSIMLKNEGFRLLLNAGDYLEFPVSGLGATTAKIRENPEQIKRVLRALYEALVFIRDQRDQTVNTIAGWLKVDRAIAADTYDLTSRYLSHDGAASEKAIMARAEEAKTVGQITRDLTINDVTNFSLLKSAIKDF